MICVDSKYITVSKIMLIKGHFELTAFKVFVQEERSRREAEAYHAAYVRGRGVRLL